MHFAVPLEGQSMVIHAKVVGSVLSGCVLFLGLGAINISAVAVSGTSKIAPACADVSPSSNLYYCILQVKSNGAGWYSIRDCELDECGPGEGSCKTMQAWAGVPLTFYLWCECANGSNTQAACAGVARNPYNNPLQLPPLVECKPVVGCSDVFLECAPDHIVPPPIPWVPICACN
jgi:hypothetical protein